MAWGGGDLMYSINLTTQDNCNLLPTTVIKLSQDKSYMLLNLFNKQELLMFSLVSELSVIA